MKLKIKSKKDIKDYSPLEERINITSHGIGLLLSIVGLVLLVKHSISYGNAWHIVSFSIFGAGLITSYGASTFYHSSTQPNLRKKLRVVDHAAIYILIAATYTPFTLITLHGTTGWVIFGVTWAMAITGIILKLFFTGKYDGISTLMYIFMGWLIVFAIKPLINNFSSEGLVWLVSGGVAYTTGAIIYGIKQIKLNHAIFHVFVLIGGFSHFVAVFVYVLPGE